MHLGLRPQNPSVLLLARYSLSMSCLTLVYTGLAIKHFCRTSPPTHKSLRERASSLKKSIFRIFACVTFYSLLAWNVKHFHRPLTTSKTFVFFGILGITGSLEEHDVGCMMTDFMVWASLLYHKPGFDCSRSRSWAIRNVLSLFETPASNGKIKFGEAACDRLQFPIPGHLEFLPKKTTYTPRLILLSVASWASEALPKPSNPMKHWYLSSLATEVFPKLMNSCSASPPRTIRKVKLGSPSTSLRLCWRVARAVLSLSAIPAVLEVLRVPVGRLYAQLDRVSFLIRYRSLGCPWKALV